MKNLLLHLSCKQWRVSIENTKKQKLAVVLALELVAIAGAAVLSPDRAVSAMLCVTAMASSFLIIEMKAGQVTLFPALCLLAFHFGGTLSGVVVSIASVSTGLYFHWKTSVTRNLFFSYIPVVALFAGTASAISGAGILLLIPAGTLIQAAYHRAIRAFSVSLLGMLSATWIINGIFAYIIRFFIMDNGTAGGAVILSVALVSLIYSFRSGNRLHVYTSRIKTLSLQNRLVSSLYSADNSFMLFLVDNNRHVWTMHGKPAAIRVPAIPTETYTIEEQEKWHVVSTDSSAFIAGNDAAEELKSLEYADLKETLALLENVWRASFSRRRLENAFLGAALMFVQLADKMDSDTHFHSLRVSRLSVKMARTLGLPENAVLQLQVGALLHDIGKLAVPGNLIMKKGLLTKRERSLVETHPEAGARLLDAMQRYDEASSIVLQHHEHIDGSGYPKGITGASISLFARIVAVADVFDAVTSPRAYHAGKPDIGAIQEIKKYRGTYFDANVVDALEEMLL
jgi:putative nucleotidyltransferase with HDIG domain